MLFLRCQNLSRALDTYLILLYIRLCFGHRPVIRRQEVSIICPPSVSLEEHLFFISVNSPSPERKCSAALDLVWLRATFFARHWTPPRKQTLTLRNFVNISGVYTKFVLSPNFQWLYKVVNHTIASQWWLSVLQLEWWFFIPKWKSKQSADEKDKSLEKWRQVAFSSWPSGPYLVLDWLILLLFIAFCRPTRGFHKRPVNLAWGYHPLLVI